MLLTAAPGTGKTTAIQKIITLLGKQNCGGFYTEEIKNSDGLRIGFDCITLDDKRVRIADVCLESEFQIGRYRVDVKGFEELASDAIEVSLATRDILIIDEIGLMQLLSMKFKDVLYKVLNSKKVVVGTICFHSHPEVDHIKKNQRVDLYELTAENRELMPIEIAARVEEQLKNVHYEKSLHEETLQC